MQKCLLHWLTALLLILGQTALLAHQTDIDAHHERGEDCVACNLAHNLDAAVTASQPPAVLASPVNEQPFSNCTSPRSKQLYRTRSRAPPVPHA